MLKTSLWVKDDTAGADPTRILAEILHGVPFLKNIRFQRNIRRRTATIDLQVTLSAHKQRHRLICAVSPIGQPRLAREACLRLLHLVKDRADYPVFIAPYVSLEARAICFELGAGFLDLARNCRLVFDSVYIERSGYANPSVTRRELRSLYSPKAERVLRVLVTAGPRRWRTQQLAGEASVSLGQVANVKTLLANREWLDSDDRGFGLRSFERAVLPLVREWNEAHRLNRSASADFYSMKPVPETESTLALGARHLQGELAFTGFSGGARLQPVVRYQKVTAYYSGNAERLAARAGLKRVDSGANVTLLSPYDEGVFYGVSRIDRASVVSPVQVYLDLQQSKGRGEEAAEVILNEVIAPPWR